MKRIPPRGKYLQKISKYAIMYIFIIKHVCLGFPFIVEGITGLIVKELSYVG